MKILYAVQKTGNGHLARAQEIIPILEKYPIAYLIVFLCLKLTITNLVIPAVIS